MRPGNIEPGRIAARKRLIGTDHLGLAAAEQGIE
jgi:hypothetical protein